MNRNYGVLLVALAVASCGGSGSSSDEAEVDEPPIPPVDDVLVMSEFARGLSYAATEGGRQVMAAENPFLPRSEPSTQVAATGEQTDSSLVRPAGELIVEGPCGGNMLLSGKIIFPNEERPFQTKAVSAISDFCVRDLVGNPMTFDGTVSLDASYLAAQTRLAYDIDVSCRSESPSFPSGEMDVAEICTGPDLLSLVCTREATVEVSGRDYFLVGAKVSGNGVDSFTLTSSITDPGGQEYTLTASDITFCSNGRVEGGSMVIGIEGGDDIDILFSGCDEFITSYQGVSYPLPQLARVFLDPQE